MSPADIADTAASLGLNVTLDGETVYLDEEVWVVCDEQTEVWDRFILIRDLLRDKGLTMPQAHLTLGRDYIHGTVVPL